MLAAAAILCSMRGMAKAKSKGTGAAHANALVGKWFHTFYDDTPSEPKTSRRVKNQGVIVGPVSEDVFLVQFYDFGMGGPSTLCLFKLEDMMTWVFYTDDEDMRHAYERLSR